MLFGGVVRHINDIERLRNEGFDFGEIALLGPRARRYWSGSGVTNDGGMDGFFLIAHGPHEAVTNDMDYTRNRYVEDMKSTIDFMDDMGIRSLNIHLAVDASIACDVIGEKLLALRRLVDYAGRRGILLNLENISETADDFRDIINAVPGIGLTIDTGHANLDTEVNRSVSIISEWGGFIRHAHFHDNLGGCMRGEGVSHGDLHLQLGCGNIDFVPIVGELMKVGFEGTITFETTPRTQLASRERLETIIRQIREGKPCGGGM